MRLNVMSDTQPPDDAKLVELVLNGNRDAFGQLVTRYQSPVCAMVYSACGDISQSEDLAQETFIIAWRKLTDLKEPAKFKVWLYGIARNLINNTFRRQTRNPLAASEQLDDHLEATGAISTPTEHVISKEEETILWRSLEEIPDTYREPLVLFYREHQSIERVAETLDLSEETVRQRLSRGRKLLHEQVIAFVEGALKQTAPGQAFTLGVMAALPTSLSTKAATLGAAAKGGAALKTAGLLSFAAPMLAPFSAFLGMWFDYRMKLKAGHSPRVLKAVKIYYIGVVVSVFVFLALCMGLMSFGGRLIQASPALFVVLMVGSVLGYFQLIRVFARWAFRDAKQWTAEENPSDVPTKVLGPLFEYRTGAELFGLPLLHIRFGRWLGGPVENRLKFKNPVKAWIAISDTSAIGALFAYGACAVAPVSVGAMAIGVFSFGAMSAGALTVGGFAFGACAVGPFAFGWDAFGGGCAIAWDGAWSGLYAISHHFALGEVARAAQTNSKFVWELLDAKPLFHLCHEHLKGLRIITFAWVWIIPLVSVMVAAAGRNAFNLKKASWIIALLTTVGLTSAAVSSFNEHRQSLVIRAFVDGKDIIEVSGTNVWFEHTEFSLPEKISINEQPWSPQWDAETNAVYETLSPAFVPHDAEKIQLWKHYGRGDVAVLEWPSKDNDQTITLQVADDAPGGDWYEFEVSW